MSIYQLDQIFAPDITFQELGRLNQFVYLQLTNANSIEKPYEILEFPYLKEPKAKSDPWTYKINSHGFRGKEWKFKKGFIPFFGCSYTFGIGVDENISSLVEKQTGKKCINVGIPGGSVPVVLKSFNIFNTIQPSGCAVITLPALDRIHSPKRNKSKTWEYLNILPNLANTRPEYERVYKVLTQDYFIATMLDYIAWAQTTAKLNNTRLYWTSWHEDTMSLINACINRENIFFYRFCDQVDLGRDNGHWGPKTTDVWATNLIEFLKEKNEL